MVGRAEGSILGFSDLYRMHWRIMLSLQLPFLTGNGTLTHTEDRVPAVGENHLLQTKVFQLQHHCHCKSDDSVVAGRLVHCKTFGSISDLCSLNISSITLSNYDHKICLHTSQDILWYEKSTWVACNWEYFYLQKIKLKRSVKALLRYLGPLCRRRIRDRNLNSRQRVKLEVTENQF